MGATTSSLANCNVCNEIMDLEERVPVCLPACGHSFCRKCLISRNKDEQPLKCPTCQKPYEGPPLEDLVYIPLISSPEVTKTATEQVDDSSQQSSNEMRKASINDDAPLLEEESPNNDDSSSDTATNKGLSQEQINKILIGVGIGTASVVGSVALIVAAPFALAGIGFTSAGIAAGSAAAGMMSTAAIANGGAVAAGSLVAILQSAGAAGIGAAATATLGGVGAGTGGGIAFGIAKLVEMSKNVNTETTNNTTDQTVAEDNTNDNVAQGNEDENYKNLQEDVGDNSSNSQGNSEVNGSHQGDNSSNSQGNNEVNDSHLLRNDGAIDRKPKYKGFDDKGVPSTNELETDNMEFQEKNVEDNLECSSIGKMSVSCLG